MKIYLVGGAVRDRLLGLPVKERDWVVVGATPKEMQRLGFLQVGKEFPVFLHPETKEEYALARTERKVRPGYQGFEFHTDPTITLEEDLKRRDITINAIAETQDGKLIDPFQGQKDLENKILRHVSQAFVEDPVRILRVARFAARFGFHIAPETMQLMQGMVSSGEVNALVAERVWKELERALALNYPATFFEVLKKCGALKVLFPTLAKKGLTALNNVNSTNSMVRFAATFHTLSLDELQHLATQYRIPRDFHALTANLLKLLPYYSEVTTKEKNASLILDCLIKTDAFRREARFKQTLEAAAACEIIDYTKEWLNLLNAAKILDIKSLIETTPTEQIADKIREKRLTALTAHLERLDI